MNNQPQSNPPPSIWKKSWTGPGGRLLWFLVLTAAAFVVFFSLGMISHIEKGTGQLAVIALVLAGALGLFGIGAVAFVRWVCCWRNFVRFLFVCACLVTLVGLAYVEENWRGKRDWEQFKREWEAKGETFDRASVIPPAVPDDQNFALTPIVASSYAAMLDKSGHEIRPRNSNVVNRLEMNVSSDREFLDSPTNGTGDWRLAKISHLDAWQKYYRALAAKTNEFPVSAQPQSPAADVLLALSRYDSTIEELRQAARLPVSRFPLEYDKDDPAAILLPHLAEMKRCTQVLQLRALAELQSGHSDQALADVKLILRLQNSMRTEPILISQLVRIAMITLVLQPVWEGLANRHWSDAQLAELDQALAPLDFMAAYKLSMRGELALCQGGIFDFLRRHPEELHNLMGLGGTDENSLWLPNPFASRLMPKGWFYQNQLRCARPMVEFYLPAADTERRIFSPSLIRKGDDAIQAETTGRRNPYNGLEPLLLPALGNAAQRFALGQNSVDLARTAVALERYRMAHQSYPESLDALITQIPHDVINGGPLHYRRTDDGQFILYSVGWNETDDGGEVATKAAGMNSDRTPILDISQGDWVWRYPAR